MQITVDIFGKICRACLCESTNMKSLFMKIDGEDRNLLDVLTNIANVRIKTEDKLPKLVCNECETIMCKAEAFKRRCLESQTILRNVSGESDSNFETEEDDKKTHIKDEKNDSILKSLLDLPAAPLNSAVNEELDIKIPNLPDVSCSDTYVGNFDKALICEDVLQIENSVKEEAHDEFEQNDDTSFTDEPSLLTPIIPECKTNTEENCMYHLKMNSKNKHKIGHHKRYNVNKYDKLYKKLADTSIIPIKNQIACQKCYLQFSTVSAWNTHQNAHREESKNVQLFQCAVCSCKFKHRKTLVRHMRKHNEPNTIKYHCDKCKREFKYKAHLENHIISVHSQNGFTCDYCMQSFNDKESLEIHRDKHKTDKRHQCEVCKKTFYMLCTLKDHMRTHTGEKPFLCSVCGKGFSQKTNLAQHMRRHQGLKPFKCETCEKRFVSKGELEAHNRTHSGAHPFVCDECGNGFTTSSSLVKHRRIHTGNENTMTNSTQLRIWNNKNTIRQRKGMDLFVEIFSYHN
ncbi:hypothetical protein O3G_MSEX003310 [Manduca sexta]|uniref:Uncharacterized protein n=1 Tax=Manduca sexta TaxID=7130 RepID=A0A921YR94_MANSE|nr:hypothetical protein O3G_MSEX003310 [Manduca sexta]